MATRMDIVEEAAKVLDKMAGVPSHSWLVDWWTKVDPDTLNMNLVRSCVLGQIDDTMSFGTKIDKIEAFNGKYIAGMTLDSMFNGYGFEWATLIRARQALTGVSALVGKKYSRNGGIVVWTVIGTAIGTDGKRVITLEGGGQYKVAGYGDFTDMYKPYVEPFKLNPGEMAISPLGTVYIADAEGTAWFVQGNELVRSSRHGKLDKLTVPGRPAITFNANEVNAL